MDKKQYVIPAKAGIQSTGPRPTPGRRYALVLASASPRRRQLLRKLKIPFKVIPSNASEDTQHKNPRTIVEKLALRKAQEVARRCRPGTIVLGADTLVYLHGRVLGKPRDRRHAYQMLYLQSGSTQQVWTGVALVEAGTSRRLIGSAVSTVRMKRMELDEILKLSRKHMDKAGSYAIQEKRDPIARVIKGSYDNVVGLPVVLVRKLLSKLQRKPSRAV